MKSKNNYSFYIFVPKKIYSAGAFMGIFDESDQMHGYRPL